MCPIPTRCSRQLRLGSLLAAAVAAEAASKANISVDQKTSTQYDAAGRVWREHGALDFVECIADDVPKGKVTSFPRGVKLKSDETVVFSWILYKSRAHRDKVNKKVMADKRIAAMGGLETMPFDARRMIYGGFKVMVDL